MRIIKLLALLVLVLSFTASAATSSKKKKKMSSKAVASAVKKAMSAIKKGDANGANRILSKLPPVVDVQVARGDLSASLERTHKALGFYGEAIRLSFAKDLEDEKVLAKIEEILVKYKKFDPSGEEVYKELLAVMPEFKALATSLADENAVSLGLCLDTMSLLGVKYVPDTETEDAFGRWNLRSGKARKATAKKLGGKYKSKNKDKYIISNLRLTDKKVTSMKFSYIPSDAGSPRFTIAFSKKGETNYFMASPSGCSRSYPNPDYNPATHSRAERSLRDNYKLLGTSGLIADQENIIEFRSVKDKLQFIINGFLMSEAPLGLSSGTTINSIQLEGNKDSITSLLVSAKKQTPAKINKRSSRARIRRKADLLSEDLEEELYDLVEEDSEEALKKLAELCEGNAYPQVYFLMAKIYFENDNLPRSLELLRSAHSLTPLENSEYSVVADEIAELFDEIDPRFQEIFELRLNLASSLEKIQKKSKIVEPELQVKARRWVNALYK